MNTSYNAINIQADDIFGSAISIEEPPSMFEKKSGEVNLPANTSSDSPVQTNNFYTNMLVDDQTGAVFTQPYSLFYSNKDAFGIAVYHAQNLDKVFDTKLDPPAFFYNPTGIKDIVFSSSNLDKNSKFSLLSFDKYSVTAKLSSDGELQLPLVQGMGFVTAIYKKLSPQLYSVTGFKNFEEKSGPQERIKKFSIELQNDTKWLLYVSLPEGQSLNLEKSDTNTIRSSDSIDGAVFQLGFGEDPVYDKAAGCYPVDAAVSATVDGSNSTYTLNFKTEGKSNNNTTLLFAYPHHVLSFNDDTKKNTTSFQLDSTTKGKMTGCLTNSISMSELLPTDYLFDPHPNGDNKSNYSDEVKKAITNAADKEAKGDVRTESDVDSMYTSGKILLKYALILYVCHEIINNDDLTKSLLESLKASIEKFAQNKQKFPLFYDTTYKGIVSSATENSDFGNGHYNDHHFHYGYHVHAAAIVAKVDKDISGSWLEKVKEWVNILIRDVANPSTSDSHFPVSRSFDFFNGHSWAKGLYASGDGKDEESTSEDYNFAFGMKLWGNVIGDSKMENRGNLMLAILKRNLNYYFLYTDDNKIEPSRFIPNKVSGILFDNKIHHTTYFGNNPEYIFGIHMLPTTSISSFIRSSEFVAQEWKEKLELIIDGVNDGWKGVLLLDLAISDPNQSYNFFSNGSLNTEQLDNGMSQTWSIAYCAGLGASN